MDDARIWKALGDPTRRGILDQLAQGPRTTGSLAAAFPNLSRFAVMKHLSILEDAHLITWRKQGRERWNALNAVPLRLVYERWVSRLENAHAASLTALGRLAEGTSAPATHKGETTVTDTITSFDITQEHHISAAPDTVWTILTTRIAEWWQEPYRMFDNNDTIELDLRPGGLLLERTEDGELGIWGTVTRIKPGSMVELSGACSMPGAVWGTFTFSVETADDGSRVTLHHVAIGTMGEGQGAGYNTGWETMLLNLKGIAERDA
jgi:DNA-binding transcriptional ArsR family regulator/uncharacterized protein YndB with AHSA1/START domain